MKNTIDELIALRERATRGEWYEVRDGYIRSRINNNITDVVCTTDGDNDRHFIIAAANFDFSAIRNLTDQLASALKMAQDCIEEAIRYSHVGHDYNFEAVIKKIIGPAVAAYEQFPHREADELKHE